MTGLQTLQSERQDQTFRLPLGKLFTCSITEPGKHERAFACIVRTTPQELPDEVWERPLSKEDGGTMRLLPTLSPTSFPSTLWQFRRWWDRLPGRISVPYNLREGTAKGPNFSDRRVHYDERLTATSAGAPVELLLREHGDDLWYEGTVDGGKITIHLPVLSVEHCEISQGALERIFPTWHTGRFEEAFPDLAKAVCSSEEVSLQDIVTHLEQESGKGPESFEAFGLKVPVVQLTKWGTVLLLSIQVYFYVHLRELSRKLGKDDPGWDVPWIGMYQSRLSRLILLVSSCIAPVLAVGLLGWYSCAHYVRDKNLHNWRAEKWELVRLFTSGLAVLISVMLSWLSWKYRPKVVMTAPPMDEKGQTTKTAEELRFQPESVAVRSEDQGEGSFS